MPSGKSWAATLVATRSRAAGRTAERTRTCIPLLDNLRHDEIVVVDGRRVLEDVVLCLFERGEHAALTARRAMQEELEAKERLAAPRPTADERRPAAWKSAAGNLVEAGDSGSPRQRAMASHGAKKNKTNYRVCYRRNRRDGPAARQASGVRNIATTEPFPGASLTHFSRFS